jgi:hypothetical protein
VGFGAKLACFCGHVENGAGLGIVHALFEGFFRAGSLGAEA